MEIIKWEKAKFERNSLILAEDVTLDEWKELGQSLKKIEGCVQFWIGDWARFGDKKGFTGKYTDPKVYDQLGEITGLERNTLQRYKSVSDNVDSWRRRQDLSFEHHKEVASLPPDQQQHFLQVASEQKLSVRDLRREVHKSKVSGEAKLPATTYRIIYADPPWSYGNDRTYYGGDPIVHYPTMSIDDICKLPVKDIAEDNAVLFIWVTSPLLKESFEVIDKWGFEYKTSFVWDKVKHNMGHYNSVRHEFLLVCTRGSCTPDVQRLFDSVQTIERTEHSSKPEEFRNIIDTIYPHGKRIELFARKKTNGWEAFGNES